MRSITTILLVILFSSLNGQDIHFSQFFNTPTIVNPATTGVIDGNHRLSFTLRKQTSPILRGDAYGAAAISYDAKIKLSESGFLGLGISGVADKAGELDFGTEQSKYLISYIRSMGGD